MQAPNPRVLTTSYKKTVPPLLLLFVFSSCPCQDLALLLRHSSFFCTLISVFDLQLADILLHVDEKFCMKDSQEKHNIAAGLHPL